MGMSPRLRSKTLPSVFIWQLSCEEEELDFIASNGVFDVSSDAELEEEDEELVELVEQDRDDSEDSDVTQFKFSFFLHGSGIIDSIAFDAFVCARVCVLTSRTTSSFQPLSLPSGKGAIG